jgi:hypothetical protein
MTDVTALPVTETRVRTHQPDLAKPLPIDGLAPVGLPAEPVGYATPAARGVVGIPGPVVPVVVSALVAAIIGVIVGILALGSIATGAGGWMIGAIVFGVVAAVVAGAVAGEVSQPVSRFWSAGR